MKCLFYEFKYYENDNPLVKFKSTAKQYEQPTGM